MASAPSFDTQKMSATANTDSITISSTIGMASSRMARPSGIAVRSRRDAASASRTSGQNRSRAACGAAAVSSDCGAVMTRRRVYWTDRGLTRDNLLPLPESPSGVFATIR